VAAQEAHDRKLQKSLAVCSEEGIHFVPLAWESTGGATDSVHETIRKWTDLESARGYSPLLIRQTLYSHLLLPAESPRRWRLRAPARSR
jgi:hypothetical protein